MEAAGLFERFQGLPQALVLDPEGAAEFASGKDYARWQQFQDPVRQAGSRWVVKVGDHFQVGVVVVAGHQLERDRRYRRGGAVFTGQEQMLVGVSEVEVGIAEGMDVAGPA